MNKTLLTRLIAVFLSRKNIELRQLFIDMILDNQGDTALYKRFAGCISSDSKTRLLEELDSWQKQGLQLICVHEPGYPERLKRIADPPLVLFSKGAFQITDRGQSCAIVGARNADVAGCALAREMAKTLADQGVRIVSGLAYGVDSAAHRGVLESMDTSLNTAVLGNGLPKIYPAENYALSQDILSKGGLIMSQFEPYLPGFPSNFLNRNRVIAGLANHIIIIQASARSGSLVTARYALEQGKDLWVVPGDIKNPRFLGSNRLIQQGAGVITSLDDLKDIFAFKPLKSESSPSESSQNIKDLSALAQEILTLIGSNDKMSTLESIQSQTSSDASIYLEIQGLLELGLIKEVPGGFALLRI